MSRSRWKSSTNFGTFTLPGPHSSNKVSKKLANRAFRNKCKMHLIRDLINNNLDNHINYNKVREVYDNWDFASDGLKFYMLFKWNPNFTWTQAEKNKFKRK